MGEMWEEEGERGKESWLSCLHDFRKLWLLWISSSMSGSQSLYAGKKISSSLKKTRNEYLFHAMKDIQPLKLFFFSEGGFMEQLDNNFILVNSESSCTESNSAPATLGLTNMAGKILTR